MYLVFKEYEQLCYKRLCYTKKAKEITAFSKYIEAYFLKNYIYIYIYKHINLGTTIENTTIFKALKKNFAENKLFQWNCNNKLSEINGLFK